MPSANTIELQVTPNGIIDRENRCEPIKLEDANLLLGLFRQDNIVLQPDARFTRSELPEEYKKLKAVIEISKGRITWGSMPSA